MNMTVVTVAIDDNAAGEVLAHDVCDARGNRLLAGGTVLSHEAVGQLARRGIRSVSVQRSVVRSAQEEACRRAEIEQRLAMRFRAWSDDPLMQRLLHEVVELRVKCSS